MHLALGILGGCLLPLINPNPFTYFIGGCSIVGCILYIKCFVLPPKRKYKIPKIPRR